jgi:ammonium transporter, Amt family
MAKHPKHRMSANIFTNTGSDNIMSTSLYQTCAVEHGDDMPLLIQCVSNWVETTLKDHAVNSPGFVASDFANATDMINWLLVFAGALVFFMQAGFAMVCAGAIRKKNVKNTVCSGNLLLL